MDEVTEISVASGSALGEWRLVVDTFENAMSQAGFDAADNAVPFQCEMSVLAKL